MAGINRGGKEVLNIYLGDKEISKVFFDGIEVWPRKKMKWEYIHIGDSTPGYSDIIYRDGTFYMLGSTGKFLKSADARTWETVIMEENGELWHRIERVGNTVFVIGSRGPGERAKYSQSENNGLTWRYVNSDLPHYHGPVEDMVANVRGYINMCGGTSFTATLGGVSWGAIQSVAPFSGSWHAIALNNASDRFVAVGNDGSVTYSDGTLRWDNAAYSIGRSDDLHNIRYLDNAGQYVALGQDGYIYLSADGLTWEIRRVGTRTWQDIAAHDSNKYVLMGADGNGNNYYSTSEESLTNWHEPVNMPAGGPSSKDFRRMVYGNGVFVAADYANEWVAIGTFIE